MNRHRHVIARKHANDGDYDLMHTSPDHLLRGLLKRDPVAVQAEGMGELAVHRRPGSPAATDRWAVDNPQSAFAFVLRAVLADVAGAPVTDGQLVPVGGTLQRFQALPTGTVDGTTLHPPFDVLAAEKGYPRLGGHLQVAPDILTGVVVAPRTDAATRHIRAYLDVCRRSTTELLTSGAPGSEAALVRHGLPEGVAWAAAHGLRARGTVHPTRRDAAPPPGGGRPAPPLHSGLAAVLPAPVADRPRPGALSALTAARTCPVVDTVCPSSWSDRPGIEPAGTPPCRFLRTPAAYT
ncbi:hypothetical protein ACGFXB_33560 [Streptomyces canus]|uniref:hypothetical protein n=1 Tax=Streptomyces canus TaxID=58343 RepID=UPI0037181D35